jgi:D-alanine--poly(phosphoribitol) ligase subunit 1
VLNFIQWSQETFDITANDRLTNANPIYFDNSVFDFYSALFSGAVLVPIDNQLAKNPKQLVQAINQAACTIWFSVPSLLVYLLTTKALSNNDFQTIRIISFGGEGFPKNKLSLLFDLYGDRVKLVNVYGPTECTCICSSYEISEKDFDDMNELAPLGFLSRNFSFEIIPTDMANLHYGELALIGPCVGLGYYNDTERTGQSFIQNPGTKFTQTMYLTGDIVERSSTGQLFFRGRKDNQVKHMGYRIELEEIEAAFSSLSYINESAVIYERLTPELGQIRAYVSLGIGGKTEQSILDDIRSLLPPYMVPKRISILEVLPKNSNGKIDRKQIAQLT